MTYQDLLELYLDAQDGDIFAEKTFRDEVRREAKRANRQRLRMRETNVKSESYYRASDYLEQTGRRSFKERTSSGDLESLLQGAEAIESFLNAEDFRFGKRERERLEKYGKVLSETFGLTDAEEKDAMGKFLSSSAWEDYKQVRYVKGSGTLNDISELIKQGEDVRDLLTAFEDWQQGGLDIIELEEIWKQ